MRVAIALLLVVACASGPDYSQEAMDDCDVAESGVSRGPGGIGIDTMGNPGGISQIDSSCLARRTRSRFEDPSTEPKVLTIPVGESNPEDQAEEPSVSTP